MRQVDRDELAYVLTAAVRNLSRTTLRELADPRRAVVDRARATVGTVMAEALARFEIMTPAPLAGSDETFSRPLLRMMGVSVESGSPMLAMPTASFARHEADQPALHRQQEGSNGGDHADHRDSRPGHGCEE